MQNRSNFPIKEETQKFPNNFRVTFLYYTQNYETVNFLHYHNFLEIGRCFYGGGVQFINGKVYSFNSNSISIVQKGCIHDSHIIMVDPNEKPSKWKYIFIDLEALGFPSVSGESFISSDNELLFLYDLMFRELENHPVEWQSQFQLLLSAFLRIAQRKSPVFPPLHYDGTTNRIASILHFIAINYASDLSIKELASRCNVSVSYFRKVFCDNVGIGPKQYIIRVRLSMAEHLLLTTEKPIINIAGDVGFNSLSSFNRHFLRAYGCSPSIFRKKNPTLSWSSEHIK